MFARPSSEAFKGQPRPRSHNTAICRAIPDACAAGAESPLSRNNYFCSFSRFFGVGGGRGTRQTGAYSRQTGAYSRKRAHFKFLLELCPKTQTIEQKPRSLCRKFVGARKLSKHAYVVGNWVLYLLESYIGC